MTEQSKQVCSLLQAAQKDWNPPTLPQKAADMPQGDMPGDAVHISEAHRTSWQRSVLATPMAVQ